MVSKEDILDLVKRHLNRVLLIAESALPESQFRAYRKLILDEFGQSGFGKELEMLLREGGWGERQGAGRNTLCRRDGES